MNRFFYRFRGILVSPPLVFVAICHHGEIEADTVIWSVGISIFLLGVFLRIWAQQHLCYRLKGPRGLTTTGPYAFVRNPVYIGNMVMGLGITVVSELIWFIPVTLFWFSGVYFFAVRFEEDNLSQSFSEPYRKYAKEIPRWIPRIRSFKHLDLKNQKFRASVIQEIHCLLLLLPYFLKEIILSWFGY
ncbi:MAG: hypothetical protein AMJ90_09040 [candidate division Zixibacteria bacterium SM23_73_2]|nr:MAG: hypothetical protein AMJ90_09040 [candidate division Zixibacteria bacterium SM23_73_2]